MLYFSLRTETERLSTVLRRGRGVEGAYEAEMMEALAACGVRRLSACLSLRLRPDRCSLRVGV